MILVDIEFRPLILRTTTSACLDAILLPTHTEYLTCRTVVITNMAELQKFTFPPTSRGPTSFVSICPRSEVAVPLLCGYVKNTGDKKYTKSIVPMITSLLTVSYNIIPQVLLSSMTEEWFCHHHPSFSLKQTSCPGVP